MQTALQMEMDTYIINGSGHIAYKTERSTFQIPYVTHRFTYNISEIQHMTF